MTVALVTVAELEADSQKTIPAQFTKPAISACEKATSLVCGHLMRSADDVLALEAWQVAAIKAVAMGVALDIFENPASRSTYSAEGLNFAAAPRPRRGLFASEKSTLDALFLPGFA